MAMKVVLVYQFDKYWLRNDFTIFVFVTLLLVLLIIFSGDKTNITNFQGVNKYFYWCWAIPQFIPIHEFYIAPVRS